MSEALFRLPTPFGIPTRRIRIAVQAGVFCLWVALIVATQHPIDSMLTRLVPVSFLLRIDPLVMTVVCGGMRLGVTITLLGAATLAVTFLLGRVFCGWVCPLGAIFDAYGWILLRLGVPIQGPSPWYFRFKYYLVAAIFLFAIFGAVSPLMGLDPIVLVTRTMAAVLGPFLRHRDELTWKAGQAPGNYGYFFDGLTLALFLAIMSATTRLSRIWCRTACPLGAYLAVASRHAVLARETSGCVHCNICAIQCPTGAISFENEEVYNESECIKCYTCSQACPVDANFFTLKPPFPEATESRRPVSLERRSLLTTLTAALVAFPAFRLSAGRPGSSKKLIRPPRAREEADFLTSCIRCDECVKACPTGILKPAGLEHGLRALWTPVMVPTEGPCLTECNACSVACPTDAILKYAVADKYRYKAGTAVLDTSLCISYTDGKFCSECVSHCPTHAIPIAKGWEPEGGKGADAAAPAGQVPTRPLGIDFNLCVGCGACEFECNRIVFGPPAMTVTSMGRAAPTSGVGAS